MEISYKNLLEKIKKYNPQCDWEVLDKAYNLSQKAHDGQHRVSGEPFIIHPLQVAYILAELELDCETIVAAILHDVIEDTSYGYKEIKEMFGEQVALLVDGVTKLGKISYTTKEDQQIENLRKMFLAMAKDIRVILIKLADRLHNMRTIKSMCERKQREKAHETLEIYAPLAHRLGIYKIKWELEDLSLRYLDPVAYYEIVESIAQKRQGREEYLNSIIETIEKKLKNLKIQAHIEGRVKHFYSIYRKMFAQNKNMDELYDLFAIRVIVDSVKDCYGVLGMVHELYKPLPGRFKDYIAMPKANMYQSLHSTLIGLGGTPFEIQIRTWEMHKIAEYGIAAHWKYKEGKTGEEDLDSKLVWVRQLLEIQKDLTDNEEFLQTLKIDLFADEVFVFTPKGDVINLPLGATPLDFAYAIHSAVGNRMIGSKVNGRIAPIESTLKNGDIVEILTSTTTHGPSRDWLKVVKTSQARNKINQWFKKESKEDNIIRGKELIEKEIKKTSFTHAQLFKTKWVEKVLRRYGLNSLDDLYASVGYGGTTAGKLLTRLQDEYRKANKNLNPEPTKLDKTTSIEKTKKQANNGIIVKDIPNCLVRISKCCNAVPGDEIIGYITRGRGVSVHRKDCSNVQLAKEGQQRLIEVMWETTQNVAYSAGIQVLSNDRPGLLAEVTNNVADSKIALRAMNARTSKDNIAIIDLTVEITDKNQLEKMISKLKKISGVFKVKRSKQ